MKVRIHTPRLVLDPVRASDASLLHSHWTDPEVRKYLWDGKVIARDQIDEIVRTSDQLFGNEGVGLWVVRSSEGAFLGCAGFWYFHEPAELELVISLAPAEWGKGFAGEAARALVDHVFSVLGWPAVQASTDTPNARSLALLRALGMEPVGEKPGAFGSIEVFRIEAAEALG